MKTLTLIVILIGTCGCWFGTANGDDDYDEENQLIDRLIQLLKAENTFDPLVIKGVNYPIDLNLGITALKGNAELKDTIITGLGNLHRAGDAKINHDKDVFEGTIRLGDNNVALHTEVDITVNNVFHPKVKLNITVGDLLVTFAADLEPKGGAKLAAFNIDEFKKVDVKSEGLAGMDPVIDWLVDQYLNLANQQAREQLTNAIRPMLEDALKNFHFS